MKSKSCYLFRFVRFKKSTTDRTPIDLKIYIFISKGLETSFNNNRLELNSLLTHNQSSTIFGTLTELCGQIDKKRKKALGNKLIAQ